MIKILQIIGARPQIIKAAALSRAIRNKFSDQIQDIIVHTGQHYDENMSNVFMREMQIPQETYNLKIGSASHGKQTAQMLQRLEEVFELEKPDYVIVYGDTNSTLSAALAAIKMFIPIIHIEAGLRSFNKTMPEEINRIVCDHCSTILFSPTEAGIKNLQNEGFQINQTPPYSIHNPGVFYCGDIMYDNSLYFSSNFEQDSGIECSFIVPQSDFVLVTIHRPSNTDSIENLSAICNSLISLTEQSLVTLVFPIHPRTKKILEQFHLLELLKANNKIMIIPPASFFEMIVLEKKCKCVITDSGGVQKEAFFFKKPCVIVRDETEWVEIVDAGCAVLTKPYSIAEKTIQMIQSPPLRYPLIFGDGNSAEFICEKIIQKADIPI